MCFIIKIVMYIELESLSNKNWLINISDIVMVEERTSFTPVEIQSMPMLSEVKSCCAIIIRGRNETFWVRDSYKYIKKLLTRYGKQNILSPK